MKLYNEMQCGFTTGTNNDKSEIIEAMQRAILNNALGYNEMAIIHYKRAFELMLDSFDPTSEKEGYDLIESSFEYLTGFYDSNPFESLTVDRGHNSKNNEYLVEIVTKTGLIFDLIVLDNTHRQVKHLALKTV